MFDQFYFETPLFSTVETCVPPAAITKVCIWTWDYFSVWSKNAIYRTEEVFNYVSFVLYWNPHRGWLNIWSKFHSWRR